MDAEEDLDQFLYGEEFKAATTPNTGTNAAAESTTPAAETATTIDDEDEYEDEEDFEIVLDSTKASEINKRSLTSVSIGQEKGGSAEDNKDSSTAANAAAAASAVHFDPFAPANLAGKMLYDHDLDSFEDKPWRKPGADLTDYFNYGFNETTWRAYCIKQRALRDEYGAQKKISVASSSGAADSAGVSGNCNSNNNNNSSSRDPRGSRSSGYASELRSSGSNYPADARDHHRYSDSRPGQHHYDRHYESSSTRRTRPSSRSPPPSAARRIVRRDGDSRSPPP